MPGSVPTTGDTELKFMVASPEGGVWSSGRGTPWSGGMEWTLCCQLRPCRRPSEGNSAAEGRPFRLWRGSVLCSSVETVTEGSSYLGDLWSGGHSGGIPRRWCLETQADRIIGEDAAQSVMSFWGRIINLIPWSLKPLNLTFHLQLCPRDAPPSFSLSMLSSLWLSF